jgi:hypothetical protein
MMSIDAARPVARQLTPALPTPSRRFPVVGCARHNLALACLPAACVPSVRAIGRDSCHSARRAVSSLIKSYLSVFGKVS